MEILLSSLLLQIKFDKKFYKNANVAIFVYYGKTRMELIFARYTFECFIQDPELISVKSY